MKFRLSKDFIRYELIGLEVEVIESKNPNLKGIHGTIVDETKNTFVVLTESGKKVVPKKLCTFLFYYKGFWVKVNGNLLCNRPWERVKQKIIKKL